MSSYILCKCYKWIANIRKRDNNKYYRNGKLGDRINISLSGAAARTGDLEKENSKRVQNR